MSYAVRRTTWLPLIGFVAVVAAIATVGSLAASSSQDVYLSLDRPAWAPPAWLFGPVWTVLYLMIAAAGWQAYRVAGSLRAAPRAFAAYGANLILNALWTPLFFAAGAAGLALADIVLLDLVVVATIVLFARLNRIAAALLVPYLGWILFASALNLALL